MLYSGIGSEVRTNEELLVEAGLAAIHMELEAIGMW